MLMCYHIYSFKQYNNENKSFLNSGTNATIIEKFSLNAPKFKLQKARRTKEI